MRRATASGHRFLPCTTDAMILYAHRTPDDFHRIRAASLQPVIALTTAPRQMLLDNGNTRRGNMLFTAYRSDSSYCSRSLSSSGIIFPEAVGTPPSQNKGSLAKDIVIAAQFTIFTFQLFSDADVQRQSPSPRYPAHAGEPDTQSSCVQPIF